MHPAHRTAWTPGEGCAEGWPRVECRRCSARSPWGARRRIEGRPRRGASAGLARGPDRKGGRSDHRGGGGGSGGGGGGGGTAPEQRRTGRGAARGAGLARPMRARVASAPAVSANGRARHTAFCARPIRAAARGTPAPAGHPISSGTAATSTRVGRHCGHSADGRCAWHAAAARAALSLRPQSPQCRALLAAALSQAALTSVQRSSGCVLLRPPSPQCRALSTEMLLGPRSSRPQPPQCRVPQGRARLTAAQRSGRGPPGGAGTGDRRRAEVSSASRGRAVGGGGRRGRLLSPWARPGLRSLCASWEPDQGRDRGPPPRRASESGDGGWRIRGSGSESRVGSASGVRLALLRRGSVSESGVPVRVGALSRRSSQGLSELRSEV